jgi:hypothetical protein
LPFALILVWLLLVFYFSGVSVHTRAKRDKAVESHIWRPTVGRWTINPADDVLFCPHQRCTVCSICGNISNVSREIDGDPFVELNAGVIDELLNSKLTSKVRKK